MVDTGRPDDHVGAPLGVLFTGYMEKKNPASLKGNHWEKRFLVLTYEAFYWFRRRENYELFGEERGHIYLKDLMSVRALHDDDHQFELTDKSSTRSSRYFRPVPGNLDDQHSNEQTEEWITAIRSAMTHLKATSLKEAKAEAKSGSSKSKRKLRKRQTITMKKFVDPQEEEERRAKASLVKVQMLSVKTNGVEVVIARNPEWQDIMTLPQVDYHDGDEFLVSTSNGGIVRLTKRLLEEKCTVIANSDTLGINEDEDDIRSNGTASPSTKRKSRRSSASEKYKNRLKNTLSKGFKEATSTSSSSYDDDDDTMELQGQGTVVAGAAGGAPDNATRQRGSSAATAVEALFRQTTDDTNEISNKCFPVKVEGVPLPCSVYMFAFRDATLDLLEDRNDDQQASASSLLSGIKSNVMETLRSDLGIILMVMTPILVTPYLLVAYELFKSVPTTDPAKLLQERFSLASPPVWLVYSTLLFWMTVLFPWVFTNVRNYAGVGSGGRDRARTLSIDLAPTSGLTYRLVLLGYSFTSEDNPVEQKDHELPARFATCEPTLAECRKRYDLTRHWRETEGINKILQDPQPWFHYMKYHYPHYQAGRGREGHIVAYTRPGELNMKALHEMGFDNDFLLRHWIFDKEYQWEVLCNGDDDAKGIDVIDVKGVSLFDLMGSTLDFVKKTMAVGGNHYPNRAQRVYIVNASTTFTRIYGLLKAFIPQNTLERLKLIGEKQADILFALQEDIDIDQIPDFYGGDLRYDGYAGPKGNDSVRFNCPETLGMCAHVQGIPGTNFDGFDHLAYESIDEFKKDVQQGTVKGFSAQAAAGDDDGTTTTDAGRSSDDPAPLSRPEARSSTIKSPPPQVQTFLQREVIKRNSQLATAATPVRDGAWAAGEEDDGISELSVSPTTRLFYDQDRGAASAALFEDSPAPAPRMAPSPSSRSDKRRSQSERVPRQLPSKGGQANRSASSKAST